MKFWYGSGSSNTYLSLTDPDRALDPAIFVSDLQDGKKRISKFCCFKPFELHLHNFSKVKSHKEVTKQQESRFFLLFLLDDPDREPGPDPDI